MRVYDALLSTNQKSYRSEFSTIDYINYIDFSLLKALLTV